MRCHILQTENGGLWCDSLWVGQRPDCLFERMLPNRPLDATRGPAADAVRKAKMKVAAFILLYFSPCLVYAEPCDG